MNIDGFVFCPNKDGHNLSLYVFPQDSKRVAEVERLRKKFVELKEWSAKLQENGQRLHQKTGTRDLLLVIIVYFFQRILFLFV